MTLEIAIEANKNFTYYYGRTKVNDNLIVADSKTLDGLYAEMRRVIKDFEGINEFIEFEIVEELAQ